MILDKDAHFSISRFPFQTTKIPLHVLVHLSSLLTSQRGSNSA
jgi:hypothetical protein